VPRAAEEMKLPPCSERDPNRSFSPVNASLCSSAGYRFPSLLSIRDERKPGGGLPGGPY